MKIKYIMKLLKSDPAKVTMLPPSMYDKAVKEYPKCISYIPSRYISKELCWDAIKSGVSLTCLPHLNNEVAEFVIRRRPEYVCCCKVTDERLRRIAIETKPSIIQNLDCTDKEMALALSIDPSLFGFIRFSKNVQRMAIKINPDISCYLPECPDGEAKILNGLLNISNS